LKTLGNSAKFTKTSSSQVPTNHPNNGGHGQKKASLTPSLYASQWVTHPLRQNLIKLGPGAIPAFSYWNGKKYKYVDARIEIYAPLYASMVVQTAAFQKLKKIYEEHNGNICLWDFDGYDHFKYGMTLEDALYEEKKKMGHGFVLMMLLKGEKYWENPKADRLAKCDRYVSVPSDVDNDIQ
jgi:hypothetical protein